MFLRRNRGLQLAGFACGARVRSGCAQRKEQIAEWLRAGYSAKGVWNACRRATPPFEGSYQTFWRYCRMHELSVARGQRPALPGQPRPKPGPGSKTQGATRSPKIWPRLEGKPREFVPRPEDLG